VREHDGGDEADHHQRKIFGRAEGQADLRQRRGEQGDDGSGDCAGEQGRQGGRGQRRTGAALAGHLVAVDAGDHRRGFARHVDEDRRGRAAVLRPVEDAGQHDEARDRLQVEGEGKKDRHRRYRADAGQDPDEGANEAADEGEAQVGRGQGDGEAGGKLREKLHLTTPARHGW
jgi:hypothetical protein